MQKINDPITLLTMAQQGNQRQKNVCIQSENGQTSNFVVLFNPVKTIKQI
jgi:hypothetical protein